MPSAWHAAQVLIHYRALEKLTEICSDQPIKCSRCALSASLGDVHGRGSMVCKGEGARRRIGTTRTPFLQACIHCSLSWLNPTNASTHLDAHTYCAATGKRPNGVLPSWHEPAVPFAPASCSCSCSAAAQQAAAPRIKLLPPSFLQKKSKIAAAADSERLGGFC